MLFIEPNLQPHACLRKSMALILSLLQGYIAAHLQLSPWQVSNAFEHALPNDLLAQRGHSKSLYHALCQPEGTTGWDLGVSGRIDSRVMVIWSTLGKSNHCVDTSFIASFQANGSRYILPTRTWTPNVHSLELCLTSIDLYGNDSMRSMANGSIRSLFFPRNNMYDHGTRIAHSTFRMLSSTTSPNPCQSSRRDRNPYPRPTPPSPLPSPLSSPPRLQVRRPLRQGQQRLLPLLLRPMGRKQA